MQSKTDAMKDSVLDDGVRTGLSRDTATERQKGNVFPKSV
jgi:hypothetical protein